MHRKSLTVEALLLGALLGSVSGCGDSSKPPGAGLDTQQSIDHTTKPVQGWIADLKSPDKTVRQTAYTCLKKYGDAAVDPLIAALEDPNGREYTVNALAELKKAARPAIPKLIPLLKDPSFKVRGNTVKALALCGASGSEALEGVGGLTKDSELGVRLNAVQALPQMAADNTEREKAATLLVGFLSDTEITVKLKTLDSLARCGPDAPTARATLAKAMQDTDPEIRSTASSGYPNTIRTDAQKAEAVPVLIPLLKDADKRVRENAIVGLANMGPAAWPAFNDLKTLASDPEADVRANVAYSFSNIADPKNEEQKEQTAAALLPLLKDKDPKVINNTLLALGGLGGAAHGAIPTLMANVSLPNLQLRAASGATLEQILAKVDGRAAAEVPELIKALNSPDKMPQKAAILILAKFGPTAKDAIEPLQNLLTGADPNLQKMINEAIAQIKAPPRPAPKPDDTSKKDGAPAPVAPTDPTDTKGSVK